jgi:hypothetical protein
MEQGAARSPPPLRSLLPAPAGGVRKESAERQKATRVNACEACRVRKSKASTYTLPSHTVADLESVRRIIA